MPVFRSRRLLEETTRFSITINESTMQQTFHCPFKSIVALFSFAKFVFLCSVSLLSYFVVCPYFLIRSIFFDAKYGNIMPHQKEEEKKTPSKTTEFRTHTKKVYNEFHWSAAEWQHALLFHSHPVNRKWNEILRLFMCTVINFSLLSNLFSVVVAAEMLFTFQRNYRVFVCVCVVVVIIAQFSDNF